jgi:hypothetical protein
MPAPPISNLTNIFTRGEVFPPGLYSQSGRPEIGDPPREVRFDGETKAALQFGIEANVYRERAEIRQHPLRVCQVLTGLGEILDAQSRARNALEPVEGGTYVLRHDDEGDKRHVVAVSPTWIVDTYMGTGGRDLLNSLSGPW